MRKPTLLGLALLLLFIPQTRAQDGASAALGDAPTRDIIGTIVATEGIVTISALGERPVKAIATTPVHTLDMLATGPRGRIMVQLIDDTRITLGQSGQMTFDNYIFDDGGSRSRLNLDVPNGSFLLVTGDMAQDDNATIEIKTANGIFKPKQGSYWGGMLDNAYGVVATKGQASFTTDVGQAKLGEGQGTWLRTAGDPPGPVKTWDDDRVKQALQSVALKAPDIAGQRMTKNAERNQLLRKRHREALLARGALSDETAEQKTAADSNAPAAPRASIADSLKPSVTAAPLKPKAPAQPVATLDDVPMPAKPSAPAIAKMAAPEDKPVIAKPVTPKKIAETKTETGVPAIAKPVVPKIAEAKTNTPVKKEQPKIAAPKKPLIPTVQPAKPVVVTKVEKPVATPQPNAADALPPLASDALGEPLASALKSITTQTRNVVRAAPLRNDDGRGTQANPFSQTRATSLKSTGNGNTVGATGE